MKPTLSIAWRKIRQMILNTTIDALVKLKIGSRKQKISQILKKVYKMRHFGEGNA